METNQTRKITLSEGETLGHKHVLESGSSFDYTIEADVLRFILKDTGLLTHDEHDRMVLAPGKFRRYHQFEFNPMDNSIGRVFD